MAEKPRSTDEARSPAARQRASGKEPRVLILSWYGPGRRDAGERIRVAEMAAGLRSAFEIKWGVVDADDAASVYPDSVDVCPASRTTRYRVTALDYLRAVTTGRAIEASRLGHSRAIRRWANDLLDDYMPDIVWVNQPFMWPLVPSRWRSKAILDTHNVNSARLERIASSSPRRAARVVAQVQSRLTKRFERDYVRSAAVTLAVSELDASLLESMSPDQGNVLVLPNGARVIESSQRSTLGPTEPARLLFLGSLSYSANVDAVRRLADWLSSSEIPAQVTVAGSGTSPEVTALCEERPQLNLVGRVDDARETMAAHHGLIATHSQGGGSRIKVLEALATRLPVIGTAVAVEGLGLRNRESFLRVESAGDLIEAVTLLRDEIRMERLVESGWAVAKAHQWSSLANRACSIALGVVDDNDEDR